MALKNIVVFIRVKILRRFIDLRKLSKDNVPYDEIIRIELLVAMCLIAFCMGMGYIILGIFVKIPILIIVTYFVFYLTTIPLVLTLTKKGFYNQAKLVMMILGNIFMLIKASSLGRGSGMNLAMLIILFATFAFYSIQDYKYILLSLFIVLSGILFLEYTDYSFISNDQSTNKYEYELNLFATILFCILFFYIISRVNQYMNKKLKSLNIKLLNKNRRLAQLNEELDSYIYKASHDMRLPITSMMGILNIIKLEKNQDKIHQLIELQQSCLDKLDNHIHQIINLSKNVKTEIIPERVDIKEMFNEVFEELYFFENANNTKKIVQVNQNTDFFSDPYRLKIIINNLVSNAFKYARAEELNPSISIQVTITSLSATVTIKDNGIGVSPEHKNKIFDMFYRGTEMSKGSGLGLYMVKEMIQKLNGSITVDSEINQFTSITFVLPNLIP